MENQNDEITRRFINEANGKVLKLIDLLAAECVPFACDYEQPEDVPFIAVTFTMPEYATRSKKYQSELYNCKGI